MKLFSFQTRALIALSFLTCGAAFGGAACSVANLAGSTSGTPAAHSENGATQAKTAEDARAATETKPAVSAETSADLEGTYSLNNHREGKGGYENTLTVEKAERGKIRVSFEGAYFFDANGEETFHDTAAYGTLTLNGNVARGKFTEEGSDNGCAVELNFTGERVNLKSSNCDLNVTPDGTYKKGAEDTSKNLDADVVEGRTRPNSNSDAPYIQYDESGEAVGLVNLMERAGEREGCGEEVETFTGKVMTVTNDGDFDYEFTLAGGDRRRQKISLIVASDDKLPYDDLHALIKTGNNLEVRFIYCGNGGFANPTAIYKK